MFLLMLRFRSDSMTGDELVARAARDESDRLEKRVEVMEARVQAWQIEVLRQHPTKEDLASTERRIIRQFKELMEAHMKGA